MRTLNLKRIIGNVMVRESHRITERKSLFLVSIIVPIITFPLLGYIYYNHVVTDIPLAVADADHSRLSQTIIRSLSASRTISINRYLNSFEEIQDAFRKGDIQGAIYIPDGLEKRVKSGRYGTVSVFENASNLITGNLLLEATLATTRTISAGILVRKFSAMGFPTHQAMEKTVPIRLNSHSLFNPGYNYENFLVPGLLPALLQMMVMLIAVLLVGVEFNEGSFAELYQISGGSTTAILMGKFIPYILIFSATVFGVIGILFPVFGISVHGSVLVLIALFTYFFMAVFFVGLAISCVVHNPLFATEIAIFFSTPAFIFSGYTFPLWGMPKIHAFYAQLLPSTHFLSGYIKLYMMGSPVVYVTQDFLKLTVFLIPSIIFCYFYLKRETRSFNQAVVMPTEDK